MSVRYRDVILEGELVTAEPFTYTDPDWNAKNKKDLPALPLLNGVPYITGSALRGTLRRAATRALFRVNHQQRFSPAAMVLTAVGGVLNAKPKDDDGDQQDRGEATAKESSGIVPAPKLLEARAANPVLSLFGTMSPRMIPGVLAVSHCPLTDPLGSIGWAGTEPEQQARIFANRTDLYQRDSRLLQEVASTDFDAYYAEQCAIAAARTEAKNALSRAKRAYGKAKRAGEDTDELGAAVGAAKQAVNGTSGVQSRQSVNYPYIAAGAHFASTLRLMRATDEDLALFSLALDYFAADARMGGHQAAGMGLMDGEWTIRERPGDDPLAAPVVIGNVAFTGRDYARARWSFNAGVRDFHDFDFNGVALDYLPPVLRAEEKGKQGQKEAA